MRFRMHIKPQTVRLDMIALINCLFILNIFFLLTSSVVYQPGVRVDLPLISERIVAREANELFITLMRNGHIYLAEKPSTWIGLKIRLRKMHKADPSRVVVIKADKDLSHEKITRAISYAKAAGFHRISLAVGTPQTSPAKYRGHSPLP